MPKDKSKKESPDQKDQKTAEKVIKELIAENPSTMAYPTERGGIAFQPTKEGAIKSKAYAVMNDQIQMQYDQMEKQIKLLAKQMQELKDRHDLSLEIYKSKLTFEPVAGHIYYLYQKDNGEKILSMLSPEEWGEEKMENQKLEFKAKVILLADFTWKIL
jgi:hypothetical protein